MYVNIFHFTVASSAKVCQHVSSLCGKKATKKTLAFVYYHYMQMIYVNLRVVKGLVFKFILHVHLVNKISIKLFTRDHLKGYRYTLYVEVNHILS